MALHIDGAELQELLGSPYRAEELSSAHGTAALVVDLDHGPSSVDERLQALPCVTIGLHHGPPPEAGRRLDVLLGADDHELLDQVVAGAETRPVAATTFVILLRDSERRDTEAGLAAESAVYSLLQAGPEFAAWRDEHHAPASAPEPGPVVRVERDGSTLRVTLDRPHRHNAFNLRLRDELTEALGLALADASVDHVELRGAGPSFCSGGDLDEFGTFPDPATAHVVRLTRSAARMLATLASRTDVRLHGACMGAGIELAAFAGRVVADPDTVIALPEVSLGLVPGAGGTVSLPRRIGRQRTALLGLTGMRIDAVTALAWGLVDAVEPVAA